MTADPTGTSPAPRTPAPTPCGPPATSAPKWWCSISVCRTGTGAELAARLTRVLGYRPSFVAVTGQPDQAERTAQAGIDHHLEKPFDPYTFLALVSSSGDSLSAR